MQKKKILSLVCLLLLMVLGGEVILSAFAVPAEAATVSYSNVLEDLEKDVSFNPEDYPANPLDYSLDVITLSEGEHGEIFLYVYQPSDSVKDLKASKINMSLKSPSDCDVDFSLYDLTWINSNGVFDKYIINNLVASHDDYRYYSISTIYRKHDESIDDPALDADDNVDYEGIAVGKSWCFTWLNGELICDSKKMETASVIISSVGFTRYFNGFEFFEGIDYCDAHFIAFSIDNFDPDWVYNAKISFTIADYYGVGPGYENLTYSYSNFESKELIISHDQTADNGDVGYFGKKYSWNRIVEIDDFISETEGCTNEFVSEEQKNNLLKSDFVIRFHETEFSPSSAGMGSGGILVSGKYVSEVTILQLSFLSHNKNYNLGVVADILSDDGNPDFNVSLQDNVINQDWWQILVALLGIIILISILTMIFPVFRGVLDVIWLGFKGILKLLWNILMLPFKFLRAFVRQK